MNIPTPPYEPRAEQPKGPSRLVTVSINREFAVGLILGLLTCAAILTLVAVALYWQVTI